MSARPSSLLFLSMLLGCPAEKDANPQRSGPSTAGAFEEDATVRLDAPTMGSSVQSPFQVEFTLGVDVDEFELALGDERIDSGVMFGDGQGTVEVEASVGRHTIRIEGWDADGNLLNSHWVDIHVVAPDGPWVTITTPSSGALVSNPVRFGVEASEHIDAIEIQADDWPLGVVSPGDLLSYEFSGTGYERSISAYGYGDGEVLASDSIQITIQEEQAVEISDWNAVMLDLIDTYPTDGSYTYDWSDAGHGTTMDVYYNGEVVADAGPGATCFCCGITFEVYMRAFAQIDDTIGGDGLLNGMSVDDVLDFRRDWFVRDLWGDGPGVGFVQYGLGEPVLNWSDVLPGDPVQFWRFSGSGHSVIFIAWVTDTDDTIVGLDYWSTQTSTDGIGYEREYFGTGGSDIDPSYFYASRAWMPHDWMPW